MGRSLSGGLMPIKTIKSGACVCICDPSGDYGLEGFELNETYLFEKRDNGKKYIKVFHDENHGECCGVNIFKRYFKEL